MRKPLLVVLISAILITFLFNKQTLGLNLLIYEFCFLGYLIFNRQFVFKGYTNIIIGTGLITTLVFTILTHSVFSYIMHFILLFTFIGSLNCPYARSLISVLGLSFSNIGNSINDFFKLLSGQKFKGRKAGSYFWRIRIYFIPIIIITAFIIIYSVSNSSFNNVISEIGKFLNNYIFVIFWDLDWSIVLTFFSGALISIYIILRSEDSHFVAYDKNSNDLLIRNRRQAYYSFRINSLKNEYRSGVFLLLVLNLLILILNIIDIKQVWFGFSWEGQFLKDFVHTGTYLLILSIIISIIIVLYYFRRNLNFYSKNKFLKILSYIWIIQNGILIISVAIRNFWYIYYYALAYKRIGVIIFLVLTLIGLITVFIKVRNKKSAFYLLRVNTLAALIVLSISSLFNWDNIIARYNFSQADHSFLHLEFLSRLSNSSLPYLDKPLDELLIIEEKQKELFSFRKYYMSPEKYYEVIQNKKDEFIKKYENRGILSWNYADCRTYNKLTQQKP